MRKEEERKRLRIAFLCQSRRMSYSAFQQLVDENKDAIEMVKIRMHNMSAICRFKDGTVIQLVHWGDTPMLLHSGWGWSGYDQIIVVIPPRTNPEELLNNEEMGMIRWRICNGEVPEDFVIQKFEMV